jgi:signal transduction histidine kinase
MYTNYRKMTKKKLINNIKSPKSKLKTPEHKRSEEDSTKQHNQLERQAVEQTKELTTTMNKLQLEIDEHNNTKERLYGIAHDFNNGLQSILGHITLAKKHTKKNEQIYETLEDARKAIFQLKSLTQQLSFNSKGRKTIKRTTME